MIVIVINGPGGSGKDTFINFFDRHTDRKVFSVSTIDAVKKIARKGCHWDGKKDEAGRRLLMDIKAAWIRYNDGPFLDLKEQISRIKQWGEEVVLFIHCREPEEIAKICEHYDTRLGEMCLTLMVNRPGPIPDNEADRNTTTMSYGYYCDNIGDLDYLNLQAKEFAKWLMRYQMVRRGTETGEAADLMSAKPA